MDDADFVRMVDQMDLLHSDNEEIMVPSSRHPRRIYSDSEASDSEPDLEGNDSEEALKNFREVTVANDSKHNPRPQFMEIAGPKHMPLRNSPPREYFDLFFTQEFLSLLKNETNRYARQFLNRIDVPSGSRAAEWKTTTVSEMRAFIAVLLEMGVTRRPTLFSYWSTNHRHIPWFGQMFSRNRFQLICKFFHVVDNNKLASRDSPEYDATAKFQLVVTHANNKFKYYYSPYQHLSIDESLVGMKCRTSLGGIDTSDMMLYSNLDERRALKYWKKVVFSIFSRMVLNAYILYQQNTDGGTKARLDFITDIIQSITREWMTVKRIASDRPLAETSTNVPPIGVQKLPGKLERVCVVCSRKDGGPKRKSRTICNRCNKGLHGVCISSHEC